MIPGEPFPEPGDVELNAGLPRPVLTVANTGDRPIRVGSHCHCAETNAALSFDREIAKGQCIDIAAARTRADSALVAQLTVIALKPEVVKRRAAAYGRHRPQSLVKPAPLWLAIQARSGSFLSAQILM
jgi:urease beta subunit